MVITTIIVQLGCAVGYLKGVDTLDKKWTQNSPDKVVVEPTREGYKERIKQDLIKSIAHRAVEKQKQK